MHESHCQLQQAFALKGGHIGHTHPNYHQMVLLSNLRKDIEKSHRERKTWQSHGTESLRSDGFRFLASDYRLTSFYSEMCSLEFFRLDWWFFFLFLFGILSSGRPHCGWQVGVEETQCRCSKTKQMNWVCEAKVLRSKCPRSEAHIINCSPKETTTRKSSLSRLKEYRPSGPVNLPEFETVEVQKNTHKFGFSMFCILFTYLLLFFACVFACVRWGFSIRSWLSWTRWA